MSTRALDLTGQIFGRLTAVHRVENDRHGAVRWLCVCICGTETVVRTASLRGGHTRSCGCYNREATGARTRGQVPHNVIDILGQVFGRLTVVERGSNTPAKQARWWCVCTCGERRLVSGASLRKGNTRSCGCWQREVVAEVGRAYGPINGTVATLKHGHSRRCGRTPTYVSWKGMGERCYNPGSNNYAQWGGRGITICDQWRGENGFAQFLADMGERPEGTSIDRIDNDGPYSPENCRWATALEQAHNKRPYGSATHE